MTKTINYTDQITLQYWSDNKIVVGSKAHACFHNGYIYRDHRDMNKVGFVYKENETEIFRVIEKSPKQAYVKLIEKLCSHSAEVRKFFLNTKAEKYRIFTEKDTLAYDKFK